MTNKRYRTLHRYKYFSIIMRENNQLDCIYIHINTKGMRGHTCLQQQLI